MGKLIVPSTCLALLATTALAQSPPPPPAIGVAAQTASGQRADIQGIVKAFKMTPVGDLEGMILTDGIEIHVPPHLSSRLAAAVRPGEPIRVLDWRNSVPNFILATSLTDRRGQIVVDQGPPAPGTMPPPPAPGQKGAPGAQQATVQGRVQQVLHGPAGDVNGALLDDATLKLPPPLASQASSALRPGEVVTVQGWALSNSYGRAVDAQTIGAGSTQVTQTPFAPPPSAGMPPPPPPPAPPRP
jgi:hypothetical protein